MMELGDEVKLDMTRFCLAGTSGRRDLGISGGLATTQNSRNLSMPKLVQRSRQWISLLYVSTMTRNPPHVDVLSTLCSPDQSARN